MVFAHGPVASCYIQYFNKMQKWWNIYNLEFEMCSMYIYIYEVKLIAAAEHEMSYRSRGQHQSLYSSIIICRWFLYWDVF